jgi:hypothetical protein
MPKLTTPLCRLFFAEPIFPTSLPPGTERPEPYGFPLKEQNFFRADDADQTLSERYVGWHDWAVLLNAEVGRLSNDARACLEGQHPVSQTGDQEDDHSFSEVLVAGLPQFLLSVWELELNGWTPPHPKDSVSRVLLDVRGARPVGVHRSAVDAAFVNAFTLAGVLELRPGLRDGLAALRQRHARHHTAHPWCWLRFFCELSQIWDIRCLLRDELRRWQSSAIITPEQIRCERWFEATQRQFADLQQGCPGFEWSVADAVPVDVAGLAQCILHTVTKYDHDMIVEELLNEPEFFSQWVNRFAEQHALAEQERLAKGDDLAHGPAEGSALGDGGGFLEQSREHEKYPRLVDWALGVEHGDKWHVFKKFSGQWRHKGRLTISEGREHELLIKFAENGGRLEKYEAIRLINSSPSPRDAARIMRTMLKTSISRLRSKIREALGLSNTSDPLPWEGPSKGWRAAIEIGYAVQPGSEHDGAGEYLQFRTYEQLRNSEQFHEPGDD